MCRRTQTIQKVRNNHSFLHGEPVTQALVHEIIHTRAWDIERRYREKPGGSGESDQIPGTRIDIANPDTIPPFFGRSQKKSTPPVLETQSP